MSTHCVDRHYWWSLCFILEFRVYVLCVWLCPGPRLTLGVFLSCSPPLFFWGRVSCWIWSSWVLLSWLASKRQESVCLQAILHPRMYYRNHIAVPDFFSEFYGSRLSSACSFSKHISDGIISPAVAWTFLPCGSVFLPVQLCSWIHQSVVAWLCWEGKQCTFITLAELTLES